MFWRLFPVWICLIAWAVISPWVLYGSDVWSFTKTFFVSFALCMGGVLIGFAVIRMRRLVRAWWLTYQLFKSILTALDWRVGAYHTQVPSHIVNAVSDWELNFVGYLRMNLRKRLNDPFMYGCAQELLDQLWGLRQKIRAAYPTGIPGDSRV